MERPLLSRTHAKLFIIREIAINVISCAFFGVGALRFYFDFQQTERLSSFVIILFYILLAVLSLIRRFPKTFTTNPFEWLVACLGMFIGGMFMAAPSTPLLVVGETLQVFGLLITVTGLISLNRSYAIVPANRGIKTTGLYRVIRHPLYFGYAVSDVGILLSQFSVWNLLIAVLTLALFVLRIRLEEAHLLRDEAYQHYCQKTRYRLIPGIW